MSTHGQLAAEAVQWWHQLAHAMRLHSPILAAEARAEMARIEAEIAELAAHRARVLRLFLPIQEGKQS